MSDPTRTARDGHEVAAGDARAATHAEFYLCVARAFLAPTTDLAREAFIAHLADDLDDMGHELGLPIESEVGALRDALAAIADPECLLRNYSRLFLAPPAPAQLNAGRYLDGAVMGSSVRAMEHRYQCHGLARADGFRDLGDHVAVQLEFTAHLLARAAEAAEPAETSTLVAEANAFLCDFVAPWLPALCADIERAIGAGQPPSPYLHLARLLQQAVEDYCVRAPSNTSASRATC